MIRVPSGETPSSNCIYTIQQKKGHVYFHLVRIRLANTSYFKSHTGSCFCLSFSCFDVSNRSANCLSSSNDLTSGGLLASSRGIGLAGAGSTVGRTHAPHHESLEADIDESDCMDHSKHY